MTVFEVAELVGCQRECPSCVLVRPAPASAIRRAELALSAGRRAGLDRTRRADENLVKPAKGGTENGCTKDLQTERLPRQPTLRSPMVVRRDVRRQTVADARG